MPRVSVENLKDIDELSNYKVSDMDTSGEAITYYGYLNAEGEWYITEVTASTVRYKRGTENYSSNWDSRAQLTYGLFSDVF